MNFYALYLDHVQLKVFPFDLQWKGRAFYRASKLADSYAIEFGSHRITLEDEFGAIVYRPKGD